MYCIYLTHKFHNLSWITEINELFHAIRIYWDAPVYEIEIFRNIINTFNNTLLINLMYRCRIKLYFFFFFYLTASKFVNCSVHEYFTLFTCSK